MTVAPVITTDKVTLRPHQMEDMAAFWAFHQSDRAAFVGRPKNLTQQWYGFASEVGSWALQGQGGWAIETPEGALAGQVAITQPPHFPEREIGWFLLDGFEGRGLALAAAQVARDYAFDNIDSCDTLVSYIHPDNQRSIALAKRLGAAQDMDATLPDGETAAETVVYRHRRLQ